MLTMTNTAVFAAFAVVMASVVTGPAQAAQDLPPAVKPSPASSGIPANGCRFGYFKEGSRLCMTGVRGPNTFSNAELDCQDISGRVAAYTDWRYRIFRGDGIHAPVGWWLGPITADNTALFVNQDVVGDFDGETSRFNSRFYACAHDVF